MNLTNWAGNLIFSARRVLEPTSLDEAQDIVARTDTLRIQGTRHSFNAIADHPTALLSTRYLDRIISLDGMARLITVEAGITYGQIGPYLYQKGFALHNLASLPHISIAGACATATHGSGMRLGNLATAVAGIEFIDASGELVRLDRKKDGDRFAGAVVGLGCVGVVTKLTLDLQPAFSVQQNVYRNLPLDNLTAHFDEIMGSGYSVSLFTDWQTDAINQVWIKRRVADHDPVEAEPVFFGASRATRNLHPISEHSAAHCTEQMGIPGPWHERLPHFRTEFTPSSGEELQTEYFIPRPLALEALERIVKLGATLGPLLLISEIRAIAADDLWMSPCYRQACIGFHFTWKREPAAVQEALPVIEKALAPLEARPHWGKIFTLAPELVRARYPRISDFKALVGVYDPDGKFRNPFIERCLFAD